MYNKNEVLTIFFHNHILMGSFSINYTSKYLFLFKSVINMLLKLEDFSFKKRLEERGKLIAGKNALRIQNIYL